MCPLCETSQLGSGTHPALQAPMDTLSRGRATWAAGMALLAQLGVTSHGAGGGCGEQGWDRDRVWL